MANAQDIVNSVIAKQQFNPVTPKPTAIAPVKYNLKPIQAPSATKTSGEDKDDKGLLGGLFSSAMNVVKFPATVIQNIPTIIGKGVQTVGGVGEALFSIGTNVFNENLYHSRTEVDYEKGKALGLSGSELIAFSLQRSMPLVAPIISSIPKTGARLAETATLGMYDTGAPGFDYYQALRQGELGNVLIEDVGNVVLAGRLSGLGNVGVKAGTAISKAGAPRLGSAVSGAGMFAEQPIGSVARSAGRGLGSKLVSDLVPTITKESTKFQRLIGGIPEAGQRIAASETPLRGIVSESIDARRAWSNTKWLELQQKIVDLNKDQVQNGTNNAAQIALLEAERNNVLNKTGLPKMARAAIDKLSRQGENLRTQIVSIFVRFKDMGAIPETVTYLRDQETRVRTRAAKLVELGETERAANLTAQADFIKQKADIKEADTEGVLSQPAPDWVAPATTLYTTGQVNGIIDDLRAGKSMEEIIKAITPEQVGPELADMGYGYSELAIQKAIDYAQGRLTPIERIQMDIYQQMQRSWHQFWWDQSQTRKGYTTETVPYTYAGMTPDPGNILLELDKPIYTGTFKGNFYEALDEFVVQYLEQIAPGLADELKIDLANPKLGLWEKLAKETVGSPAYDAAYKIVQLAFDELRAKPEFARFMQNEMIYPAAMRISMLNDQRRLKMSLNDDIGFVAEQLQSLIATHGDIISKSFLDAATKALEKALGPESQFDLDTFKKLQRNLASIIKATSERLDALRAQEGVLKTRQSGVDAKLIDAISTMAEMQRIIQAITENPQAILGDTPKLTTAVQAEQANLSRIETIPDEMAQVDVEIKAEIDRQKTENAYLQQELDNTQVSLDEARTRATETADAEATVRQQLDQEQAYLDAHGKLTAEEIAALQSDFETALRIHDQYATGEKFVSKGTAEATKRRLVEEATQRVNIARGLVDSLMPSRLRRARTMTIGLATDPNAMSFMQEDFRAPFEQAVYQAIGDPKLAKKAYNDFVNSRTVMDEGVAVDQLSMETGRDFASDSDFMAELGRAWAEQWQAEKDLGRAKQKGVEAIRKELAADNQGMIDQATEASTVTGQTLPWIERMIELDDRAVLAEATRTVEGLRRDLAKAEDAAKKAQADLNKLATKASKLADQVRPKVPNELLTRRSKLEKETVTTQKAVARLAKAVETATRQQEKTLQTRTRGRLQGIGKIEPATVTFETLDNQGNPVRIAGTNPNAGVPVLNKTVADKLTDQEQQALNETVNINLKVAKVREQVASNQPLQTEATNVLAQSDINQQAQLGRPVGPQQLNEPPIYFPGGTTSAVAERVAVPMTMRSEGIPQQVKAQYENTKRTGVMATSAGQQAGKLNEIMGQFSRNVVVEEFVSMPEFALPVANVIGAERISQLEKIATDELRSQNIPRNTREFDIQLRKRTGELIIRELRGRGYEPISPVKFGEAGTDAPYSPLNLQAIVPAEAVDANTIAMRIGLRDTIASRFEPVHGNTTPSVITRVFDKVGKLTSGWKSVVLPFSLRWQIGDLVGNVMNAWVRGDIPASEMVRAMNDVKNRLTVDGDGILRTLKSDVANQSITDPVIAALIGSGLEARGLRAAELKAIQEGTLRPAVEQISTRMFPKFRQKAFNVNATQNLIARAAVAISKLEAELASKGRTLDEIDPITLLNDKVLHDAVVKAVQETNDTLGAFSEMTPWERNTLRQVFPFWSWMKFINKAAAQLVLDQPDRVLFYGHLGSLYSSGEGKDLLDWLKDKTPTPLGFMDFRFLNPYSDAMIFSRNPIDALGQTFTRPSPVIMTGIDAVNAAGYYATGKNLIPFGGVSRPSYLEGRLGETDRDLGDLAGEFGYMALNRFGGPFRNVLTAFPNKIPIIAPEGRLLGTDVAIGPVNRYPQGSARTKGIYAERRLDPTVARIGAILTGLGIPAPIFNTEKAYAQGETQAAKDQKARLRRRLARLQSRQ